MAYGIDASTLAELQAGRANDRYMVLFDLVSGYYGFWGGLGTFSYNAVTYVGAGSLIGVEDVGQVSDGSAVPLILTLTAIPNSDLSPDVLASIENETYHQRPVVIMTAYFSTAGVLISVETEYRGYVDKITHEHVVGGEAVLRVHLESKARDHTRRGYRMRSDADQRLIDPNDGGLRHTIQAATVPILWGRTEGEGQKTSGNGLFSRWRERPGRQGHN
ncbi:MAG: hypothetical protein VW338_00870 [Rhodospirillaceae bacterium]